MVAQQIPRMASLATLAEYTNKYLIRTGQEPQFTAEETRKFRDGSDDLLNHLCQIF
jgi:hypothetical protein